MHKICLLLFLHQHNRRLPIIFNSYTCTTTKLSSLLITKSTVKFHVTHILGKLNAEDRTQAVITALKRGLASLQ